MLLGPGFPGYVIAYLIFCDLRILATSDVFSVDVKGRLNDLQISWFRAGELSFVPFPSVLDTKIGRKIWHFTFSQKIVHV